MVNEDWFGKTDSARKLAIDYLYERIPCPFLEEERCSIYSIRPLICREYMVTSPPEHCFDPATLKAVPVRLPLYFSRVLNAIGAEVEHDTPRLDSAGLPFCVDEGRCSSGKSGRRPWPRSAL